MTTATDLLTDGFDRVRQVAHSAVDGLADGQLTERLDPDANTIAWLVWHLARVQDDHVADVASHEQVWTAGGWHERFGLDRDDDDAIGYGDSSQDVAAVRASGELLLGYLDAVHEQTIRYVEQPQRRRPGPGGRRALGPAGHPGGAAGQRHLGRPAARGQASYIRGILLRRN